MERVDHVDILKIGSGGFVCDVDGVLQREIPDREGLELGVAGFNPALILLVELAQADRHLAATGTGCRHDHQRAGCLHVLVLAKTVGRVNEINIRGIALNDIVVIDFDTEALQSLAVGHRAGLSVVMRDHHPADQKAAGDEDVAQPQYVLVIGDAQVAPNLVLLNIHGTDNDDDLRIVLQLREHPQLAVRLEPRQHSAGVEVVIQLPAEFQVKFMSELRDALLDVLRLDFQIFPVIKTDFHIITGLKYGMQK